MLKHSGLLAWALFLLSMLLGLKKQIINQFMRSVARQYRWHHIVGLSCLLVAWVHILYQFSAIERADWAMFFDFTDAGILSGWISILLMSVAIVSSFFQFRKYLQWYVLHLLLLPAVAAIIIHTWVMTKGQPHGYLGMALAGFTIALFVLFLLEKFSGGSQPFTVVSVQEIAHNITELHLSAVQGAGGAITYAAGSIIYLRFSGKSFSRTWHPFSVASCRFDPELRLLIKGFGADTFHLHDLPPGAVVTVKGPFREVSPDFTKPQIWIAGGIGIATFAGFSHCLRQQHKASIHLLYFVRDKDEKISVKELGLEKSLARKLHITVIVDRDNSLPGLSEYARLHYQASETQIFLSGPPKFMKAVRKKLLAAGAKHTDIHTEEFTPW